MARILLVDDDVDLGRLLEHVLVSAQYKVDRTDSVMGACSRLGSRSYDLVLADARLQDGTGMEVADRARERGTRTLIITGYAFSYPELRDHDFLLKPVRPDELLNEIERLLGSAP
jgi:two-component system, NtrC family, response regulator HydG